ncbi:hypothetical protein OEZ85_000516 [Tetradesmus obliquus]|uniref:Uncharacterized protein n=1 Tax=Tetradesmus obliquus TaxID=3088 RepID=A0ABY8UIC1_TETOB|nr:hypothetical protein OEZ85_000516 [Tetradesmus obliquus]
MVNDAGPEFWEAVGGSIASDLILIPPAFRDLLGSGWAGGSGRLPAAAASSRSRVAAAAAAAAAAEAAGSAAEQQQSAAAARMLVVQYARTLRRSTSAAHQQPSMLASNLLTLHLLAPEHDKLQELLPQSAEGIMPALTAADAARQLQLQPLFQVHGPNCWRVAALARNGTAWQGTPLPSKDSRSFFCFPGC